MNKVFIKLNCNPIAYVDIYSIVAVYDHKVYANLNDDVVGEVGWNCIIVCENGEHYHTDETADDFMKRLGDLNAKS